MRKIFFLTVISLVTFSGSLSAQWTQTNGPYGGNIRSIAVSGSLLYAGTFNGIFISSNNGLEWHPGGLENKSILSVALIGENIFAAVYVGYNAPAEVYLTTDNGSNWELVTDGLNNSYVNSLAASGTNILASTWDGLFLSDNKGKNWVEITNNLPAISILSLTVSENNILISSYEKGIFISSDNGSNWNNLGLKNYSVHSMAMSGNNILAASYETGVLLSTDKGSNWNKVNDLNGFYINTLAVNGNNFFATTDNFIFISTDNGYSWTKVFTNAAIFSLAFTSTKIIAGTSSQGILLSIDKGKTWVQENKGLNANNVQSIIVNGENIYAGTSGGGFFMSTDKGSTWIQKNMNLADGWVWISSIVVNGDLIYAGTTQLPVEPYLEGVYTSSDDGINWTKLKEGRTLSLFSYENNVFAGMLNGVYVTDDGTNWSQLNFSKAHPNVSSFAAIEDKIFAGTYYYDNGGGIFVSVDKGTTWVEANNGLSDLNVYSLTVSGDNIFAGTKNGGVYFSSDKGANWKLVNQGLPDTIIYSLAAYGPNIFAACEKGVYLSTDNGTNWRGINDGLPDVIGISELCIDNNIIFAATEGAGVWKRSLSDIITSAEREETIPDYFALEQNFPNPFNPNTVIKYRIPENGFVTLKVFDILGKEIAALVNEEKSTGRYEVNFNPSTLANGIYIYQLKVNNFISSKKMVLLK